MPPLSLGSLFFVHIFFLFCTNTGQNNALCIIISNFWVRTMDLAWDGVDTCLHNFEGNWQRRVLPYQNWSTQQNMIPEFMDGGKAIQIMSVRNLWPKFTRSKYLRWGIWTLNLSIFQNWHEIAIECCYTTFMSQSALNSHAGVGIGAIAGDSWNLSTNCWHKWQTEDGELLFFPVLPLNFIILLLV
jgi:hypothetical protein